MASYAKEGMTNRQTYVCRKKLYKTGKLCYSVKEAHRLFVTELSRLASTGANGRNKP